MKKLENIIVWTCLGGASLLLVDMVKLATKKHTITQGEIVISPEDRKVEVDIYEKNGNMDITYQEQGGIKRDIYWGIQYIDGGIPKWNINSGIEREIPRKSSFTVSVPMPSQGSYLFSTNGFIRTGDPKYRVQKYFRVE